MLASRQSRTTVPEKKKTKGMEQHGQLPGFTPGASVKPQHRRAIS